VYYVVLLIVKSVGEFGDELKEIVVMRDFFLSFRDVNSRGYNAVFCYFFIVLIWSS